MAAVVVLISNQIKTSCRGVPEMDKKETAQERAFRLLEAIYERTVSSNNPVHATQLAQELGMTVAEAQAAWRYLDEKGLIKTFNIQYAARINANGTDLIENARKHPNNPIPQFNYTTYNNVTIGRMEGGAIAQAGAHSNQHQTVTYNSKDLDELRRAIEVLEHHIDELKLDDAAKRRALAEAHTIKAQLTDDKPNQTIIREVGKSLRNVIEGAISDLIAKGVTEYWPMVLGVLMRITS
jgi:hypothetical protein